MSRKGSFHHGLLNNPSVPRFEVFVTLAVVVSLSLLRRHTHKRPWSCAGTVYHNFGPKGSLPGCIFVCVIWILVPYLGRGPCGYIPTAAESSEDPVHLYTNQRKRSVEQSSFTSKEGWNDLRLPHGRGEAEPYKDIHNNTNGRCNRMTKTPDSMPATTGRRMQHPDHVTGQIARGRMSHDWHKRATPQVSSL
ncbi:hypothetical protein VTN02DRAFT_4862 [Thermoascus thermophilus]